MPLFDAFLGGFNAIKQDQQFRADLSFREKQAQKNSDLALAIERMRADLAKSLQEGDFEGRSRLLGEEAGYTSKRDERLHGYATDLSQLDFKQRLKLQNDGQLHEADMLNNRLKHDWDVSVLNNDTARRGDDLRYRSTIYGIDTRASIADREHIASTVYDPDTGIRRYPAAMGFEDARKDAWDAKDVRQVIASNLASASRAHSDGDQPLSTEAASNLLSVLTAQMPLLSAPEREMVMREYGGQIHELASTLAVRRNDSLRRIGNELAMVISGAANFEDVVGRPSGRGSARRVGFQLPYGHMDQSNFQLSPPTNAWGAYGRTGN